MLRIALTGGIASGKSTVARMFEQLGAPVIHTDELARHVVRAGSDGLQQLVETFGEDLLDNTGELDRNRLRERVFQDEQQRRQLEQLLHPLILAELQSRLDALPASQAYAIVEIPLLAETGSEERYDRVLVVDCDPEVQLQRLQQRDGTKAELGRKMLSSQAAREERLALADNVIDNTSLTLDELQAEVQRLDREYRRPA